jgi:putative ABC transport system ATP-binding protein
MQLFARLNEERGMTILIVTHEPEIAAYAKRIIAFRDGRVLSDGKQLAGVT